MDQKNNIVALFVNSRDRVNIMDSTTNFTIVLKKSLRNIAALQVAGVVIPRTDTLISVNNNTLSGAIIVDTIETDFEVVITSADYTETTLAAELQAELNANTTMLSFPISWTVTWNSASKRMEITATYADGASHTWAIRFDYTSLIDVIGLGDAGTVAQTFTATAGATTLSVPCNRTANVVRALSYNITSARLTNSINTSYIKSLGKLFAVDGTNDMLRFNAAITSGATALDVPFPASSSQIDASQGQGFSMSMSADGNIIAAGSTGFGAFMYMRIGDGTWAQLTPRPVRDELYSAFGYGQGKAVAISGDGNTLAIGGFGLSDTVGAVYVFTRIGSVWTQQGSRLVGAGAIGASNQGCSVSLSINGNRMIVGGRGDNGGIGSAWVWLRTAGVWAQEAQLFPVGPIGAPLFGTSVAMSGAGDIVVIGGPADNAAIGATWVFSRVGIVWGFVTKIIAPDGIGTPFQGEFVAISSDGSTLAFGSRDDDSSGAAWVYIWNGIAWVYEDKIIVPSTGADIGRSGGAVALSLTGDTLIIGTPGNISLGVGTTSVYTRAVGVWSAQATQLSGTGAISLPLQGWSVATSATGDEFATGGPGDNTDVGAFWTFTRVGPVWGQVGAKHVGTGAAVVTFFGNSVAISSDGLTLVATNRKANAELSSAFVYVVQGIGWVQQAELVPNQVGTIARETLRVSISADGNMIAIGDEGDTGGAGASWIFTRAAGVWTQQTKIVGSAPIVAQGRTIRLSQSGTTVIIGGSTEGVRILNLVGSTWVEATPQLGAGVFGGAGASWIDIATDGATLAVSASSGGAAAFVLSSGTWAVQGPNFNTFYAPYNPVNTFADSIAISPDGNTIAAGSAANTDGPGGEGAVYVFTRTAGTWAQTAAFTGSGAVLAAFGGAVAMNANVLVVGGSLNGGNDNGSVWVFDRAGLVWTERTRYDGADFDYFGRAVDIQKTGPNFIAGAPTQAAAGYVREIVAAGTEYKTSFDITLPSKSYSVFDVFTVLTRMLEDVIAAGIGYTVTFDFVSTLTITASFAPPAISHTFVIDPASTFNIARWISTVYRTSQTSEAIDFSINNDVLKQVVSHSDNSDNVIVDNTPDITYRKYPAGYTISDSDEVDIQLRNDRDQIIDLNGANWIMTIYATVRS